LNLDIRIQPLVGSGLVERYLARDPALMPFFAGDPHSLAAFRTRLAEVGTRFGRGQRALAAAALRPTTDAARARLARFVEHGGAAVTTGQQAGLFTGPLLTLYKALTTVRLADALEQALGTTVLPVFWVASEDHDWAEIDHVHVVDGRHRLLRIAVETGDRRPLPVAERPFDRSVVGALNELERALPPACSHPRLLAALREAYAPGRGVAEAFSDALAAVFAETDMLLTDAADPAIKRASLAVAQRELAAQPEHEAALNRTADELSGLGLAPQVPILPRASNLFLRTEHGRERLFRDGEGMITRDSRRRLRLPELQALLEDEPGRFSPNVLLRPVIESTAFPVLAYVAGPGEIAYFAQLGSLFRAHGIGMPLVYPRASILLVEERAQRLLAQTGADLADLHLPRQQLVRRRSREAMPPALQAALAELRSELVRRFDRVGDLAAPLDPSLRNVVGGRRNRVLLEVEAAERKILRVLALQQQEWVERVDAARNHLRPQDTAQERVLNGIPYLAQHGPGLLAEIAARIPLPWHDRAEPTAVGATPGEVSGPVGGS
jgi:bacillithiol synthase